MVQASVFVQMGSGTEEDVDGRDKARPSTPCCFFALFGSQDPSDLI